MNTLTLHFEGYWQCRQATDPDPSRDPRGASGFTWAVGYENDLDQIIRLQRDEIPECDFREAPAPFYPPGHPTQSFGVFVTHVTSEGQRQPAIEARLRGGKVRWLPAGNPSAGPRFELRNTIVYSPNSNGISMPIIPFDFQIESPDGAIRIRRDDPLDRDHPEKAIWEMGDWREYNRRCPVNWWDVSDETMQAIGVTTDGPNSFPAYFLKRKEWLELQRSQTDDPVAREAYSNRLRMIQVYSTAEVKYRLEARLGMRADWAFSLGGDTCDLTGEAALGGRVSREQDWPIWFWMGGFDGDLMRGYLRGTLTLPLETPPG